MSNIPAQLHATVDLRPNRYQSSLRILRMLLETDDNTPFLRVGLRTPADELIELQIRQEDAYVIGFKGGGDKWYGFEDETGVWGPPCGVGVNYHSLGSVGRVTYDDLRRLGEIGRFTRGAQLDRRLVAIAIGLTAEAARHSIVATYLIGLTNSVGTEYASWLQGAVDFDYLRHTYFTKYAKRSKAGDPSVTRKTS